MISNNNTKWTHHYKYLFTPSSSLSHSFLFSFLNHHNNPLFCSDSLNNIVKMSNTLCLSLDKTVPKVKRNESFGGLSFLQSMSDITTIIPNKEDNKTYVHPIEKRSVSKLNEKSLEMCTESLGTETGSESGDDLSLLALEATTPPRVLSPQPKRNLQDKKSKMSRENTFPPPIKFVEDSKYNRMVRWLDEDGRVVVQAIRVLPPSRCFVEDRSEGRLRLCLRDKHVKEDQEEEEETEEGIDEENSENLEGKNGNKKLSRFSRRCKENDIDSKPMLTTCWKQHQFWVAT